MTVAYKSMTKVVTTGTGTGALVHTVAAVGPAGEICLAPTIADDGKQFYIRIFTVNAQQIPNGDWEESLSTYTHSTKTWGRETFLRSSTGSPINFAAGTKHIALVTTEETLQSFVLLAGGTMTGELLVRCVGPQLSLGPDNSHTYQVSVDASGNATLSATGNVTISPTGGAVSLAGNLLFSSDNADDIGTNAGVNRPRSIFAATSISSSGEVQAGSNLHITNSSGTLIIDSRGRHQFPADGVLALYAADGTTPGQLQAAAAKGLDASGANTAASNLTLKPGVSTGNATPASIVLQSTVAGSSGSTAQTLSDTLTVTNGGVTVSGVARVDRLGITSDRIEIPNTPSSGYGIAFAGGTSIRGNGTDNILLINNAETGFGLLQLGGTTSSPALKRSGTTLQVRLADDSADAGITASSGAFSTTIKPGTYTVAGLPTGVTGAVVYCSNLRVFNAAGAQQGAGVGTGGYVIYNGTNWVNADAQSVTAVA